MTATGGGGELRMDGVKIQPQKNRLCADQEVGAAGMPNFYHIQRIMQRSSRS